MVEETENGICRRVDEAKLTSAILRYVTNDVRGEDWKWTVKQSREAGDFWRYYTTPVERPADILWADEPGRCYQRLPWDRAGVAEMPEAWMGLINRIENRKALLMWIGSLFVGESDLQQYVWLYGGGGDGKGALARFLERALKHTYASLTTPGGDRFWVSGLLGKRLGVFPDCNDSRFVISGLFKSLTGGDAQRIEFKGQDSFTARIFTKFMFLSNERPAISGERSDVRRAIYCEMAPHLGERDPDFEEKLWASGGEFLRYCIALYTTHCGTGPIVDVDLTGLEGLVSSNEEHFEAFFDTYFDKHADTGQISSRLPYTSSQQFQELMATQKRFDRREQNAFRSWLRRRHNIDATVVKLEDGTTMRRYLLITKKLNAP